MLRQSATENKAQKVSDTVTVSGTAYRRGDFEDPAHPGFSVPGRLFTSAELQACGLFGLVSPSGFAFHAHLPLPLQPDATRVSREDAPAQLLEAAAAAWRRLEEIRARIKGALERRAQAENAHRRAAARADKSAYNAAISAEMQAEEERKALELEEAPPRKAAADAEERIVRWCRDESLYRTGSVERPAALVF